MRNHLGSEALNEFAPGLPAVSKMAPTPFIEPTTAEYLAEQSEDPFCRQLASIVGTPGPTYSSNCNGIPLFVAPIDRASQKVVPQPLQAFLHAYHDSQPAGHTAERSMFNSMR